MKQKYAIVHYDEIALKGGNRPLFEKALARNIRQVLGESAVSVKRGHGQHIVEIAPGKEEEVEKKLEKIPGIAFFSIAVETGREKQDIFKTAVELMKQEPPGTFKVDTKRHDKQYPIKSPELNALVGEKVIEETGRKAEMREPDVMLTVEISPKHAFISTKKIKGVGGLPVGTAGKMLSLISGGIDSPVASYLMMKRGARMVFVHFHNKTQERESVKDKIERLVKILSAYQGKSKLYIIPFEQLQKQIIMNIDSKLRMIIYRRFMFRIASEIADKEGADALVIGDSLAQVASQTLSNIKASYTVTDKLLLSPLIGLNKQEIIDLSKKIGTFETSILPYGDCCSFFLAKHPETKATKKQIEIAEFTLKVDELVKDTLSKAQVKEIAPE